MQHDCRYAAYKPDCCPQGKWHNRYVGKYNKYCKITTTSAAAIAAEFYNNLLNL